MRRLLRLPSLHSRAAFSSSVEAPASSVRHEISEENLRVHLEKHGILDANQTFTTTQFTHGQSNPTYSLYVDGEPRFVVRRQPPGELLPGAHRVDREFRVMSALGGPGSTAPVPRTRIYSEDASLVGTPFFVYDFVEGWFHPNPALPNATSPEERRALYNGMADAIARVHAADVGVMGLEDFGKHEGYVGRQIKTWSRAYAASATQQMSAMDTLREKLPSLDPTQNRAGGKVFVAPRRRFLSVLIRCGSLASLWGAGSPPPALPGGFGGVGAPPADPLVALRVEGVVLGDLQVEARQVPQRLLRRQPPQRLHALPGLGGADVCGGAGLGRRQCNRRQGIAECGQLGGDGKRRLGRP